MRQKERRHSGSCSSLATERNKQSVCSTHGFANRVAGCASIVAAGLAVPAFVQHDANEICLARELLLAAADLGNGRDAGPDHEESAIDVREQGQHVIAAQHWWQVEQYH